METYCLVSVLTLLTPPVQAHPMAQALRGHQDCSVLVFPFNTCNLKAGEQLSTHRIHKR